MPRLIEILRERIVVGDGAMGTLLYQRGFPLNSCFDALNLDRPEVIQQIHRDYLDAGAELIETNTFGANAAKLAKFGLENKTAEINLRGAQLAVEAARSRNAFAAGSLGPLASTPGMEPSPREKALFYEMQMAALIEGGIDALFLETFTSVVELELVLQAARRLADLPVIASLSFSDDGHTIEGLRINESFQRLRSAGADVVGLNCHTGPTGAAKLLEELNVDAEMLVSVYPNAGRPEYYEGRFIYHPIPEHFAKFAENFVSQGARLIGGCCGTTPQTIGALAAALALLRPVGFKRSSISVAEIPKRNAEARAPRPNLLELTRNQTVIVTELDPPKGLSLDKMIEGARALKEAGTDFVTMADNSLAILRVSNMATAVVVQQKTGLEPIIHLACRDRNLLGMQSELMGLHALGIAHVLALTGDPAKVGDHPGASSVYDLNSIGLIKTIKRLNEGFAANGRDLKGKTQFVIGCAFNPNSRNLDSQVRKLSDKIEAGTQFVMTQPIFDPALAKVIFERLREFRIPVFVGVMPLLNSRNAEFLHNEVPGIVIPDGIREKLRGKDGLEGNTVGLGIARELCEAVLEYFAGIYLITPLLRFDLTVELSRFIREAKSA